MRVWGLGLAIFLRGVIGRGRLPQRGMKTACPGGGFCTILHGLSFQVTATGKISIKLFSKDRPWALRQTGDGNGSPLRRFRQERFFRVAVTGRVRIKPFSKDRGLGG